MKTFQLLALLCLIIFTYQLCYKDDANKEDCKAENLSDEEKKTAEYCCFFKDGDDTWCSPLSEYRYKHIKDVIKMERLEEGYDENYSIDCKSLYLQISLLSLLLLLL
jgi:hypothetical protein